jgi:hypothetical protein
MPRRKQHTPEEAACPGGAAKLDGNSMPRGSGIKGLSGFKFKTESLYEAPISTIRGAAGYSFCKYAELFLKLSLFSCKDAM